MIGTVFYIALMRLWNNKQELLLAIVVPIGEFSRLYPLIIGFVQCIVSPRLFSRYIGEEMGQMCQQRPHHINGLQAMQAALFQDNIKNFDVSDAIISAGMKAV